MSASTAKLRFEDYADAAMEHFEATDKLSALVGQHGPFEKQKEYTQRTHEKCSTARLALTKHWKEHSCREGIADGS
jgi:hypothetical protein